MTVKLPFLHYSLRRRLVVLAGGTFALCAGVILLFFPLLSFTLEGLMERSMKSMREGQELQATVIARLMIMELARVKELLQVSPAADQPVDQLIKNLLWEKVTFNQIIEGIELIHGPADAQGRHLTYLFYRREAPELKPMDGPQKKMKEFANLEGELIDALNQQQRIDKNLLGSVNRGPKEEGEMLLRYMPVHVLLPEEGAVYWGVAKIGIDTTLMRQLLRLQREEQDRIRRSIWLEIILSLALAGLLALGLLYIWARNLTAPLSNLSTVADALNTAEPQEFDVWLENLQRVDPQRQVEVQVLKQVLLRVGSSLPKLGKRLLALEGQACFGRIAARSLPILQDLSVRLQERRADLAPTAAQLRTELQNLHGLQPAAATAWQSFDLASFLESAWRLMTLALPAEVQLTREIQALPLIWGSPGDLQLGVLYLLDFAVEHLAPAGALSLQAIPTPPGGVQMVIQFSGPGFSQEECQHLMNPFQDPEEIGGSLGPALAAAVAAQHGGSLKVQPREGGGLVFSLELPSARVLHADLEPLL